MKRLLSFLLSVTLLIGILPTGVFAEEIAETELTKTASAEESVPETGTAEEDTTQSEVTEESVPETGTAEEETAQPEVTEESVQEAGTAEEDTTQSEDAAMKPAVQTQEEKGAAEPKDNAIYLLKPQGNQPMVMPTQPTGTLVDELELKDPIAPINGEAPVSTIIETTQYTGTITWEGDFATDGENSGVFEPDSEDKATIALTPKDGYTFVGLSSDAFTIPGATSVTNDADSGTITATFQSPWYGYITDGHGLAAYSMNDYGDGVFDIIGTTNGQWEGTTYANDGYGTVLQQEGEDPIRLRDRGKVGEEVDMGNNIFLTVQPRFSEKGEFIFVDYIIENKGNTPVVVSVGSHADIEIAGNDTAPIEKFPDGRGFKMTNGEEGENFRQFNFFGKGTVGVNSVDTYWFGYYSEARANVFNQVEEDSLIGTDSGMAYSWKNRTIAPGAKINLSVSQGTGEAEKWVSKPPIKKPPVQEPKEYTVSYDMNNGVTTKPDEVYIEGETMILSNPGNLVNMDLLFDGWLINDVKYQPGDTVVISEDIVIKAIWKEVESNEGGGIELAIDPPR